MTLINVLSDESSEVANKPDRRLLSIGIISGLTLSVGGMALPLANRRARAILAFLAMENTASVSRERLAAIFWSESSERHARSSLRQTLLDLRVALATLGCNVLAPGRDDVGLIREAVEVDLESALHAIAAGRVPDMLPGTAPGGELLLAGYEDLSRAFADWVTTTRSVAQNRLMRSLETAFQGNAFRPEVRRQLAEVALRLDPLHEGACRVLMKLAAEADEIGIALRAYSTLYDAMGLQLDMEPSEATQALVAEIKLGRVAAQRTATVIAEPRGQIAIPQGPPGGIPVVAVLPLRPAGPDEKTGWIAEAMGEDLVRILASLRTPAVISSNSTRRPELTNGDLTNVADRLGADYLVSGTVRMAGRTGRVAVELAQAATGLVLWGESYQVTTKDVFEALEQVAANIANALGPRVDAAELRRGLGLRTDDLSAYHLLLRARDQVFRMERDALDQATGLAAEAIRLDPGYADAYATYAYICSLRIFQGWSSDPAADKVTLMDAVNTALRLDPNHARALALLGHNLMMTEHRYDEAEILVDRAVAIAPNDSDVLITCSPTCAYVGRSEEAIRRATRALRLSPHDPFLFRYQHFCSIAHYSASDFEQAAYWGLRSWMSNPNFTSNLRVTIASLSALGRIEEARPLVARHHALQPDFRAASVIARYSLREPAQREQFSKLLSEAGLR